MSEKEKGKEKEKEEEEATTLDHIHHRHPLILTKLEDYGRCYGCRSYIFSGETVYKCREKCRYPIFHEECAEMPPEVTLSLHPHHTLHQKEIWGNGSACAVCDTFIRRIGYSCISSGSCNFQIHLGCVQSADIIHAAAGDRSRMKHPSHPLHDLTLLWKPGRAGSLRCDACNTVQRGNFYICIMCQYSIHESCATLSATVNHPHLHNHPLSLVYRLPREYIKFKYKCDVCYKDLLPKYWVYHCRDCRYIVHINCATTTSSITMNNINDNSDVIKFPINNAAEELIQPFLKTLTTNMAIPNHENAPIEYKFHNPDHRLRLIITSSVREEEEKQGAKSCESDDDDKEEEILSGIKSGLVCEGCTAPILMDKKCSSSKCYISCDECENFHLHSTCFQLPPLIPSHPLHNEPGHSLTLQTRPKLELSYCYTCRVYTNGLMYSCGECSFQADIECISLPDTIKHAAHPHHQLKLITKEMTRDSSYWQRACGACGYDMFADICYMCDVCQVILHASCCLLPAQVINPTWDKHPLPLTFDATMNHPSDFYCEVCEKEMNPKRWMYHCRECDVSVHPVCFPAASGEYRHIKFGQRYLVDDVHHHPLQYRLLTGKLHCDVCGRRKYHGSRGFGCNVERCDFFMCMYPCASNRKHVMIAVD